MGERTAATPAVRVQLGEDSGSCEVSQGIVNLRQWMYFSQYALVEWL